MNKIFITGNLTADPEARATPGGTTVCTFTIAVNRQFADRETGERKADFFRINAWRQLGENCKKYLAKGKKVAVVGELQAHLYTAKNGEARMSLDVNADEVEFLSGGRTADPAVNEVSIDSFTDVSSDDIPF